ncbi:MAG TPA: acyl-CoA dehydrogenase family protein [Acidimicrobiales bacterium]|nr:acyl-CoA dehydrogenase family protein [Acidimicrobiales bacterium]
MTSSTDPSVHDVLAPAAGGAAGRGDEHADLVDAARRLAGTVLAPAAEATDQASVVPRAHLDALAAAGLNGLSGPRDAGGRDAPAAVVRQVYETLAGACGVTYFTWVQHHAPVRLLASSGNAALRARWLPELCGGAVLGGVAFAYLRRPGPPAVVARPVAGGWIVDGEAPWVTSWGLAGLFAVAARVEGDGPVLFVAVAPASAAASASLRASAPLALAAMSASATVRLSFEGLFVPDEDVISTVEARRWRERDRAATAQPHPAALGLAASATAMLVRRAEETGQAAVGRAAETLGAELAECRRQSYRLADDPSAGDAHLARLVAARAWGLDLALRAAQALVAGTGGGAMALSHPAQRLLREASFWAIQAQSAAVREATLARLAPGQRPPSS